MRAFWNPIFAILWKDMLLEFRTKDVVVSVLVFSLLVVVVFHFAIEPTPEMTAAVTPGILWVSFAFAGVLGLTRTFASEKERGNLHGLMLAPATRDVIFFGKMLSSFVFMLLVEAVVFPVFAALFNVNPVLPGFIPVAVLATLGFSTVGTLFAAMAANTRAREVMLPLLFFPVVLPAIVAALDGTGAVMRNGGLGDGLGWLAFLAVFDAVFLVVAPLLFHLVLED